MPRSPRVVMIFLRDPQSIPSPPPSFHVSRLFFGDRYASAPVFSTERAKVQIKCPSALLCCIFFLYFFSVVFCSDCVCLGSSLCLVASTSNIDKVVDLSPATPLPPPSPPQPFLPHHWPLVMSMRRRWKKWKQRWRTGARTSVWKALRVPATSAAINRLSRHRFRATVSYFSCLASWLSNFRPNKISHSNLRQTCSLQ